ncbi:hypothetical protein J5839_04150 [Methanosarcinaceae archaeon]|nr:hypothetical protein [Methanosarcinaceae archaeon]
MSLSAFSEMNLSASAIHEFMTKTPSSCVFAVPAGSVISPGFIGSVIFPGFVGSVSLSFAGLICSLTAFIIRAVVPGAAGSFSADP